MEAISRMALSNCIEFLQSYRHQIDHPAAHRMADSANALSSTQSSALIRMQLEFKWPGLMMMRSTFDAPLTPSN